VGSARYGARIVTGIVTVGYTLLLVFTTGVATAGEDSYGSVKGKVTNAATGEPLRKAYVRLAPGSDLAKVRPTVTNEEGLFVFEDVQPGNYSLEAEHAGFIEGHYGNDADAPVELRIVPGQTLSDLNIKLVPPSAISGRVRDEDGDPWTHAHIDVFRLVWEDGKRRLQGFDNAEVNDEGEFRAAHLPPGRYYLSAVPDASWERRNRAASAPQLQTTWYPNSLDSSSATPLILLPGQELTGAEIRLRRNNVYRIRGKVSGLQGVPALPGPKMFMTPRLEVWSAPGAGGNSKQGLLKQDGSFEVEGIAPGTWQILVEEGAIPAVTMGVVTVQINDHDVEGVSITVQPPHLLKGFVHIEGADEALPAGLSLRLDSFDEMADWHETTSPRADGSFSFENVPSGRHRVNLRGAASGYYVKRLRYGTTESSDAEFSVAADEDTLEVTLSVRGARVSGVVRRNDGAESGPRVVLLPDTRNAELRRYDTHEGALDQSGAFIVKEAVRPGEYTLYAFEGVPDGAWTDAEFIKAMEGKGVRIKVAEGDAKTVEVPLIPRSDIAALLTRLGMD
jgi:Carboxypeptidase regulatory-like domain